jgi:hypothetical protein
MKVSLRKTMAKALTGVVLASSLCGLSVKEANAWEVVSPSGWTAGIPDDVVKVKENSSSNS